MAATTDPHPAPGPGVPDPVPAELARLLRRAVLDHAHGERRRRFPPLLHVGVPGGERTTAPAAPPEGETDPGQALRVEVLHAMLRRVGAVPTPGAPPAAALPPVLPALAWLTRCGDPHLNDLDVAWSAAARAAGAELGSALRLVVVDRHGWRDPVSGASRRWVRLRARR